MSMVTGSQIVYMNQGLFDVLKTVGAQRVPMPISQVIDYMRTYILRKKLFNPTSPAIIICENDPLGAVFGVPTFDIREAIKHLARNLFRVPQQTVTQAQKRESSSAEGTDSKRVCPEPKRESEHPPVSPTYIYVPPSLKYNSESETDLTVQEYETEYVRGSSDDSSDRWSSDDSDLQSPFELEFEVESTDKEADYYTSASDVEDTVHEAIVVLGKDEDIEFWADFSDSDSDSEENGDFEIGESDLWQCRLCKTRNTPLLRYCQMCWKERFGWLPDRTEKHPPQRKHYRKRQRSDKFPGKEASRKKQSTATIKDGTVLSSETPESVTLQEASAEPQSDVQTENSQEVTQGSQEALIHGMCNICLIRPKCAVMIHGRTCHRFSCYKCARLLLERKRPCPVCRRTIERVARSFDA